MKRLSIILFAILITGSTLLAQDPAGNCIAYSYAKFQNDNLRRYANCGTDALFNTGSAITLEVWVRVEFAGDNQKIIGKTNGSFNSGYVLAIDQGRIYPEIWTPGLNELLHGFIPPIKRWVHLATTFENGDSIKGYVNGYYVGGAPATAADIVSNTDPLIIGVAPWDLTNFQTFGEVDEVRIWNVVRTHEEIQQNMHVHLTGTETGLVAYYDFNETSGNTLTDRTANALNCTMVNTDDTDWINSRAVIGNSTIEAQTDIQAMWDGKEIGTTQFVATTNGLSMSATTLDSVDYVVFGHDGNNSVSTSNLPTNAVTNFERMGRIWYINEVGSVASNLTFDLNNGAAGGNVLSNTQPPSYYTLLYRSGGSGAFTAIAQGSSINNDNVTFSDIALQNGYYTIGVGDAEMTITPVGIGSSSSTNQQISVYPNPAGDKIWIDASKSFFGETTVNIYNSIGTRTLSKKFSSSQILQISTASLQPGTFIIQLTDGYTSSFHKLVKE